jgi:hypothetical protein
VSKSNPLCSAPECETPFGCAHRGPHGQFCYFVAEKRLCDFLGKTWNQNLTLDELLNEIETRLIGATRNAAAMAERLSAPKPSFSELLTIPSPVEDHNATS